MKDNTQGRWGCGGHPLNYAFCSFRQDQPSFADDGLAQGNRDADSRLTYSELFSDSSGGHAQVSYKEIAEDASGGNSGAILAGTQQLLGTCSKFFSKGVGLIDAYNSCIA